LVKHLKVKPQLYKPGVAQRVGRGIALLFHDCGTGQQHAPAALVKRLVTVNTLLMLIQLTYHPLWISSVHIMRHL